MSIEAGNPVHTGFQPPEGGEYGQIYSVPVTKRSNTGRLLASGNVFVTVPDDQGYDEHMMKEMAKQKAIAAVKIDPGLLVAYRPVPSGGSHPEHADGDTPVWDGDGFLDPPDDDDTDKDGPSRILSPDSPQTGQ